MADTATPTGPATGWTERLRSRLAPILVLLLALISFGIGLDALPIQDRDEARYVQASRQMAETGDWVDIRFQDEPRHVKPAGIYWLQAIALRVTGMTGTTEMWVQRLPSYFAGALACLALIWAGTPMVGRRAAVLAGVMLATFYMLHAEARTAKTDAALLLAVVLAMGAMGRAWLDRADRWIVPGTFWTALSAGILIKGPIVLIPVIGGLLWMSVRDRSARWLGRLRPWPGLAWFALLTLPWFIAITIRTEGGFLATSIGGDLAGKLISDGVHRSMPPGTFLLTVWYTFWPWCLLAPLGLAYAWRNRAQPGVVFALGWLVPMWLVLEATPTKLIHYSMPVYPALALLGAAAVIEIADGKRRFGGWPAYVGTAGFALALCIFIGYTTVGTVVFGDGPVLLSIAGGVALTAAAIWGVVSLYRQQIARGLVLVTVAGILMGWTLTAVTLPAANQFWVSARIATAMEGHTCLEGPIALAGYTEPSAVFINGTDTILTDAEGALAYLAEGENRAAWIDPALVAPGASDPYPGVPEVTELRGQNYTNGDTIFIRLFVSPGVPAPDDPCAPLSE